MTNLHTAGTDVENLPITSRVARGLVGAGLITFVLTTPAAPLGWYTLLPLFAIFPIFTAITGWDPVKAFFQLPWLTSHALQISKPVRYMVATIGIALIGSVYVASYFAISLGWLAILPIIGIYPITVAIMGMDPITALYNLDNNVVEPKEIKGEARQAPATWEVVNGNKSSVEHGHQKDHWKAA
jgi:hypothetical protein